jgi:hypothetical protein
MQPKPVFVATINANLSYEFGRSALLAAVTASGRSKTTGTQVRYISCRGTARQTVAGPRQHSHSSYRVPRDSLPCFFASRLLRSRNYWALLPRKCLTRHYIKASWLRGNRAQYREGLPNFLTEFLLGFTPVLGIHRKVISLSNLCNRHAVFSVR